MLNILQTLISAKTLLALSMSAMIFHLHSLKEYVTEYILYASSQKVPQWSYYNNPKMVKSSIDIKSAKSLTITP